MGALDVSKYSRMAGSAMGAAPPTMPAAAWAQRTRTNAWLRRDPGAPATVTSPRPLAIDPPCADVNPGAGGYPDGTGAQAGERTTGTPLTAALPLGASSAVGGMSALGVGPGR